MKPVINFITLFVGDLQASISFYQNGLGLPTKGIQENSEHCLFELANNFSLVIYQRSAHQAAGVTELPNELSQTFIISHIAESKNEVNTILQMAISAGASQKGELQDEPWGYSGNFTDPDGYQWEIVYFPHHDNGSLHDG